MDDRQAKLPFAVEDSGSRARLAARWTELMRDILPALSKASGWSISQDHCFMRVCLDTALGEPWNSIVRPPAIRHLTNAQLAAAIAVAESLVRSPQSLHALNRRSIRWRKGLIDKTSQPA